jgi:TonB-dependent starch-binding outer membrane protein SusC
LKIRCFRRRLNIQTDDYRLQSNVYLSIELLKGLVFKTSNGAYVQYKEYNNKQQTSATTFGAPNQLNRQMTFHTELLTENTLNYTKKIGDHEINALAGFTLQETANKFNKMVGTTYPDEQLLSFNLGTSIWWIIRQKVLLVLPVIILQKH